MDSPVEPLPLRQFSSVRAATRGQRDQPNVCFYRAVPNCVPCNVSYKGYALAKHGPFAVYQQIGEPSSEPGWPESSDASTNMLAPGNSALLPAAPT